MMARFCIAMLTAALVGAVPSASTAQAPAGRAVARDGQKDFDWEIGTWTTRVKVRRNPLSGATPDWADYEGTSDVKSLISGRANFVDLSVGGPRGRIEGGALRLYNPTARQWSLNYANANGGVLTGPVFGLFDGNGRGLFYGQDTLDSRAILVRFIITRVSPGEARFEQAYSIDGGQTWEDN